MIGQAGSVLQYLTEGNNDASKVVFGASRYNLANGLRRRQVYPMGG